MEQSFWNGGYTLDTITVQYTVKLVSRHVSRKNNTDFIFKITAKYDKFVSLQNSTIGVLSCIFVYKGVRVSRKKSTVLLEHTAR